MPTQMSPSACCLSSAHIFTLSALRLRPVPAPQGRPIYIQHIGAIKIKQLAEITNDDRMVRYHIQARAGGVVELAGWAVCGWLAC